MAGVCRVWGVLVTIGLLVVTSTVQSAAIKEKTSHKLPVYDDGFMRKLCAFLGASYVRSAKDPLCWYTWCHAGEPFHMQCPAGRHVSPHFYWSSEDPCTETDTGEKCLVGFLKNMHKEAEDVEEDVKEMPIDVAEDKETEPPNDDPPKGYRVEGRQAKLPTREEVYEPIEELLDITPEVKGDQSETLAENMVHMKKEPLPEPEPEPELEAEPEHEPEPEPQPEPEPGAEQAEDDMEVEGKPFVVQRLKQDTKPKHSSMYYPDHHRTYVVDSFSPHQRYSSPRYTVPRYKTYYHYHYSSPSYYQKPQAPAIQQPRAQFLRAPTSNAYMKPEGRKVTPMRGVGPDEKEVEPEYDAQYSDYPADKEVEDVVPEGDENYQADYDYDASPEVISKPEELKEDNGPAQMTEEQLEDEADDDNKDNDYKDNDDKNEKKKVPYGEEDAVLYDYFKTHFIDEIV